MSQKLTTVRIASDNLGGTTPVGVNGEIVHLPHNRDLNLTDDQIEALTNSSTAFTIVDGAPAAPDATGEAGGGLSVSPESAASGDGGSSLNVEPFDAAGILAQPIPKITEDLDEFSAEQIDALIQAEKASDKPRTTLIAALEAKRAAPGDDQ